MPLNHYPTLKALILGEKVTRGEAKIFCGICGKPTDIASLREMSVPNYQPAPEYGGLHKKETLYLLICGSCAHENKLLRAIDGELEHPPRRS